MSMMITSQVGGNQPNPASGDHPLTHSESGVELKSLLKLIDNVIEMAPATDDEPENAPRKAPIPASRFKTSLTPTTGEVAIPGYVTLSETLLVPVKKYPKYNFVGRILGPRGMTVKQLEKETGCKIFVRGRASNMAANPVNKPKTRVHPSSNYNPISTNQPKPSLSNISKCALTEEPLHVFIECYDLPTIAEEKMMNAVAIVEDLLSPPADGKDELKRQQLVDISLINGTYRATSASNDIVRQFHRPPWRQTVDPTSNSIQDLELQQFQMDHCDGGGGAHSVYGGFGMNGGGGGLGFGAAGGVGGDFGSVYGIAQQRRVWQKPRGPDTLSEEYAKSVSSREFVSDIVSKTKKSPKKDSSNDSMFQLSDSVVTETMKVAQKLLASHKHLTFDRNAHHPHHHHGSGDVPPRLPDFSVPPPPPPPPPSLMATPRLPTPSQLHHHHHHHRPMTPMDGYQMCYMFPSQLQQAHNKPPTHSRRY